LLVSFSKATLNSNCGYLGNFWKPRVYKGVSQNQTKELWRQSTKAKRRFLGKYRNCILSVPLVLSFSFC